MLYKLVNSLLILSMLTAPLQQQPHLIYKWKHRVLLVISNDTNTKAFQEQIEELSSNLNALNERKLMVYQVTPDSLKQGFDRNSPFVSNKKWYRMYADKKKPLEIVLFGLDGSKKLHTEKLLTIEQLLTTIDAMPMRQSEMRRNN